MQEEPGGVEPEVFVFAVGVTGDGVRCYIQFDGAVKNHGVSDRGLNLSGGELLRDGCGIVLPIKELSVRESYSMASRAPETLGIFVAVESYQRYWIFPNDVGAPKGKARDGVVHHQFKGIFAGKDRGEVSLYATVGLCGLFDTIIPCQRGYDGIGIGFLLTGNEALQCVGF